MQQILASVWLNVRVNLDVKASTSGLEACSVSWMTPIDQRTRGIMDQETGMRTATILTRLPRLDLLWIGRKFNYLLIGYYLRA